VYMMWVEGKEVTGHAEQSVSETPHHRPCSLLMLSGWVSRIQQQERYSHIATLHQLKMLKTLFKLRTKPSNRVSGPKPRVMCGPTHSIASPSY
jgi:hypothetical protein